MASGEVPRAEGCRSTRLAPALSDHPHHLPPPALSQAVSGSILSSLPCQAGADIHTGGWSLCPTPEAPVGTPLDWGCCSAQLRLFDCWPLGCWLQPSEFTVCQHDAADWRKYTSNWWQYFGIITMISQHYGQIVVYDCTIPVGLPLMPWITATREFFLASFPFYPYSM